MSAILLAARAVVDLMAVAWLLYGLPPWLGGRKVLFVLVPGERPGGPLRLARVVRSLEEYAVVLRCLDDADLRRLRLGVVSVEELCGPTRRAGAETEAAR